MLSVSRNSHNWITVQFSLLFVFSCFSLHGLHSISAENRFLSLIDKYDHARSEYRSRTDQRSIDFLFVRIHILLSFLVLQSFQWQDGQRIIAGNTFLLRIIPEQECRRAFSITKLAFTCYQSAGSHEFHPDLHSSGTIRRTTYSCFVLSDLYNDISCTFPSFPL